jgi:hypothetical protein
MVVDMNTHPLACDMTVFTPADREKHVQFTRDLLAAVQGIHEVETGFEFMFPNGAGLITKLAEFISKERLCCPFLEFTLRIGPNEQPISLTLTGLEGTKVFLREEFSEVMA